MAFFSPIIVCERELEKSKLRADKSYLFHADPGSNVLSSGIPSSPLANPFLSPPLSFPLPCLSSPFYFLTPSHTYFFIAFYWDLMVYRTWLFLKCNSVYLLVMATHKFSSLACLSCSMLFLQLDTRGKCYDFHMNMYEWVGILKDLAVHTRNARHTLFMI